MLINTIYNGYSKSRNEQTMKLLLVTCPFPRVTIAFHTFYRYYVPYSRIILQIDWYFHSNDIVLTYILGLGGRGGGDLNDFIGIGGGKMSWSSWLAEGTLGILTCEADGGPRWRYGSFIGAGSVQLLYLGGTGGGGATFCEQSRETWRESTMSTSTGSLPEDVFWRNRLWKCFKSKAIVKLNQSQFNKHDN